MGSAAAAVSLGGKECVFTCRGRWAWRRFSAGQLVAWGMWQPPTIPSSLQTLPTLAHPHTAATTLPLCSAHPRVAKVAFTGSTATGKRVYAAAAGNLRPATMELGGKSGGLLWVGLLWVSVGEGG